MKKKMILLIILVSLSVIKTSSDLYATEFRTFRPIPTPVVAVPEGARVVQKLQPVSMETVEKAVKTLFSTWNTPEMGKFISDSFYDKYRLLDSMQTLPARDAKIRLLSINNVQVLNQYVQPVDENLYNRISTVSVNARTQIEFNDPVKGFQRLEGTNEYILEINEYFRRIK